MGYTTDFFGQFILDRKLKAEHAAYLRAFSSSRRMKLYEDKVAQVSDPIREAVGLPVGIDGSFCTLDPKYNSELVEDCNSAPGLVSMRSITGADSAFGTNFVVILQENRARTESGTAQPGLWCQWTPTADDQGIEWDGGEKFYEYTSWLKYILRHFLVPWGYTLNGTVRWQGEDSSDTGDIVVINNVVQ